MPTRRTFLARAGSALALLPAGLLPKHAITTAAAADAPSRRLRAAPPPQTNTNAASIKALLQNAKSWSYQLQDYDLAILEKSTADILVVDDSIGSDDRETRNPRAISRLKTKPDGSRRIVLAYLSIGEAEEYRYYWNKKWIETAEPDEPAPAAAGPASPGAPTGNAAANPATPVPAKADRWPSKIAPAWLGDENESWSGNFAVRFEHPGWQAIFLDGPKSYLARVIDAGFDGVYLDRVDAFYDHAGDLADPAAEMVAFVARIAAAAHAVKPDFPIVPQNGEELLLRPGYADLIDAIAKEDLLYGSPTEGEANSTGQIINSVGWLSVARRRGFPVLVVEYLADPAKIAAARLELQRLGYVPTFAPRMLDALSPDAVLPPRPSHPPP